MTIKYSEFRSELEKSSGQRNTIVLQDSLIDFINPTVDCYQSLFYYDEAILEHIKQFNSVSGFKGKVGLDRLVFDLDSPDLEAAQRDAIELIGKLNVQGISNNEIGIYFSGRKGFALEVKTKGLYRFEELSETIPLYTKRACLSLAEQFESFDGVIYNTTRLYRINNTRHNKVSQLGGIEKKLFKVQLSFEQLTTLPIDDIKRYAIQPRVSFEIDCVKSTETFNTFLATVYSKLKDKIDNPPTTLIRTKNKTSIGDLPELPKNKKYCIWALEQGTYTENRDNALLRIAVHDRQQGLPSSVIGSKLFGVVDLMDENDPDKAHLDPLTESDIDRIVRQAFKGDYSYGCNDILLSSVCSDKCYLYRAKDNSTKLGVCSILDAYDKSTEFFKNYYNNLVLTGINTIDKNMPMFLTTANLLVGREGSGKTSLAINMMINMALNKIPVLFFNLDMSPEMFMGKLGSILLAKVKNKPIMSTTEFMQAHTDQTFNGDFYKVMKEIAPYFYISSERKTSLTDIMKEIETQETTYNKKFKVVIIDHLQLLKSSAKNEYERHTQNSELLTQLAKTKKVCVIGISHAVVVDSGYGLAAKGSRGWSAEASSQLNCTRPFQFVWPEKDKYFTLQLAKNRLGGTHSVDLYCDLPSGFVRELTPEEEVELDKLKQELKEKSKKR